jgi:hypothetical protein
MALLTRTRQGMTPALRICSGSVVSNGYKTAIFNLRQKNSGPEGPLAFSTSSLQLTHS